MVLLDISATGEENLIVQQSGDQMNDLEYRRTQLLKLQDAVIDLEDLSSGVSIADLTLTDFRIDLAQFLKAQPGKLESLPLGSFSVTSPPESGIPPGIVYCLRAEGEAAAKSFEPGYPLAPHYLIHVGEDGAVLLPFTQAKTVLDRLKRTCIGRDLPDTEAYARFERETKRGEDMSHARRLLSASVASVVGKKEERAVASLFTPGGTHGLKGEFGGINDFEVVAFLVILPPTESSSLETARREFATFTFKFEKDGGESFTQAEKDSCVRDSREALARVFAAADVPNGIHIEVVHAGDWEGSLLVEIAGVVVAAVGVIAGIGPTLYILGLMAEQFTREIQALHDSVDTGFRQLEYLGAQTAAWLKWVACRVTPQPEQDTRRPGCFGISDQLDLRTKRCRDCGFQQECIAIIEGSPA